MKKMVIVCSFVFLLIMGCLRPKPPQNSSWTGKIRILPIIVQNDLKETKWTPQQVERSINDANKYWEATGLQFTSLPILYITNSSIYDETSITDFITIVTLSNGYIHEYSAYPLFFVNDISWGQKQFGGLSTYPNMPFGFQYGTTIAFCGVVSHGHIVAHELGHAWNLRHTWEDKHSDTPCENEKDCNAGVKCNVMSYCFPSLKCVTSPFFTEEQIKEIRLWAWSPSRSNCTDFSENLVVQMAYPLETYFNPAID